jgi:DNA-binding NarL/FixJ family response regulator
MVADSPIRVVVCDDVAEIRRLLRFALESDPGAEIDVVGEAADGVASAELITQLKPDVVLLDLSMPGIDGLEVIRVVTERSPNTGIIVFSGFAASRMSEPALALGADRYLEKGESLDLIGVAVREVAAGRRSDANGSS